MLRNRIRDDADLALYVVFAPKLALGAFCDFLFSFGLLYWRLSMEQYGYGLYRGLPLIACTSAVRLILTVGIGVIKKFFTLSFVLLGN